MKKRSGEIKVISLSGISLFVNRLFTAGSYGITVSP